MLYVASVCISWFGGDEESWSYAMFCLFCSAGFPFRAAGEVLHVIYLSADQFWVCDLVWAFSLSAAYTEY